MSALFTTILCRKSKTTAVIDSERVFTYDELTLYTQQLAEYFRSAGVTRGTLVGVNIPLGIDYICSLLALYTLGSTAVLLNNFSSSEEKAHIVQDSGMRYYLSSPSDTLSVPNCRLYMWDAKRLILAGPLSSIARNAESSDFVVIYTSGSTGKPKGVVLTHSSIAANVYGVCEYLRLTDQDSSIIFTPSGYAYALSQTLCQLYSGGIVVACPNGLLYPIEIVEGIQRYRITGISANPTIFRLLFRALESADRDLTSVRYIMSGGQPLLRKMTNDMARFFPKARIVNMYGCTENSPRVSYLWIDLAQSAIDRPYPVGRAVRGTQIHICDEHGAFLPDGTVGNVFISGTSLMRCYWNDPPLTKSSFVDRCFRTGDLGYMDSDRNLNLMGRSDDIICVGHEKVGPEEIESVLLSIDGIVDAAVGRKKDELLGEAPIAAIVVKLSVPSLVENLRRMVSRKLPASKRPKDYILVDSIPKTLYGKIDRQALARLIANQSE